MLVAGCAPMPATDEPGAYRVANHSTDATDDEAVESEEPTSSGGLEYRLLRYRDELGRIPDDAMAVAVRERLALTAPEAKRGGVSRDNWTALGPADTYGGRINALYADRSNPQHLLAGGATGGIWQTTDAGAHWAPVNDFLASLSISSFAGDAGNPATLYAGTSEYYYTGTQGVGVLKSTDGGSSWQLLDATDPSKSNIWPFVMCLAASPASAGVLIAGTWNAAMRSTDGGQTWVRVFSHTAFDGFATTVFDVQYDPSNPSRVLLGLQDSAAAYSEDGGVSWTMVQIAPPADERYTGNVRLAFARSAPGLVYASVNRNGGEVWRSTDGGHTWSFAAAPEHTLDNDALNAIWVDPTNAQRLTVGGQDVWRSVNGGRTFDKISDWTDWPQSNHADQHAMVADAAFDGVNVSRVYFASDGGVYRAESLASTSLLSGWSNLNHGLNAVQFWGGAASPASGGLFVGGTQDHGSLVLRRSSASWSQWFSGDGGMTSIDPTDPLTFYGEYIYATVQRTVDGGASHNRSYICTGIVDAYLASPSFAPCGLGTMGRANFIAPTALDPNQPTRLWVGADSLWVTDNSKANPPSWRAVKPPSSANTVNGGGNWISAVAIQPGDSNSVWVGHNNGEIYLSADALAVTPTWSSLFGLPARMVTRIVVSPSSGRIYVTHGGFVHGNLHVSNDGGASWQDLSATLPAAPIYALAVGRQNPNLLYVGTQVGLFTSEDAGQSWTASNDAPANVPIEELSWLDDTTLIAATHGRGAFLASTLTAAAVEYYYAAWNFYFETAFPDEIAALDGGAFGGAWKRTGQTFKVWPQPYGSASPTCRFFSTAFAPKSAHFYTPFEAECDIVMANPGWQFEAIAFYIQLADAGGNCPPGTIPLYRLYNNGMGGAPNHRYTTSLAVFNQMIALGWLFEGNGITKVFACVPQ
jgi:photosystem II stability/assembly factor-like uncharacterized protein